MKSSFALRFGVLGIALVMAGSVACSSTTSGNPGSGDGGVGPGSTGTASTTSFGCNIALTGGEPECQFYEATGADAARTIAQLRAGCVDQSGATAHATDTCSATDTLGGCKHQVKVEGSSAVMLFETSFEYKPGADAGSLAHKSAAEVMSFCKVEGADVVYVASP